ncbi:MAG: J domain-containing protein [Planctomycetaceae bacterium]|nr:MAG: J domain-containing protein [Planctomycetaceae bacterium]
MTDPFEVLGLPVDADPATIRSRYLQLVREFPPDRAPERFGEIRHAYDELSDPLARLERQLFSVSAEDSIEALAGAVRRKLRQTRLTTARLLSLADLE